MLGSGLKLFAKIVLPLAVVAVAFAGASYMRATRLAVEPTPAIERIWAVKVELAAARDHQPMLDLFGDIVAGREVTLRPLVAGEVIGASSRLVEGGRIEADEVIITTDRFHYQAALDEIVAEVREATAKRAELVATLEIERALLELDHQQLAIAKRDLARFEQLLSKQTASEQGYDNAVLTRSRRRAAVGQREQSIALNNARIEQQDAIIARLNVAKKRAERDLANTELRAPFAGFVTEVNAQIGKRLSTADPIAKLIDAGRMEIRFQLADSVFGRLWQDGLIGRELTATWRLGGTAFRIDAKVARVISIIDATAGGVDVYAEIIANPSQAPLRPGAFVEVSLPDRTYKKVIELPTSALFNGDTVYAVEDGRLAAYAARLVSGGGERILVESDIREGSQVVISRLAEIGSGLRVEVGK